MKSLLLNFTTTLLPYSDTVYFATNLNKLDISPFKISGSLQKNGSYKKYSLYYATKRNKRYFVKSCNIRDVKNTFTLNREVSVYEILSNAKTKLNSRQIAIPKFETSITRNGLVSLIIEEVVGEAINTKSIKERLLIYNECINYVRILGSKINIRDRQTLGKRSVLSEVLMYPLLLVLSIKANPKKLGALTKGAVFLFQNAWRLLAKPSYVLTHRDLHGSNVLVSKSKSFIIDWENAIYADSYMEYIVLLLSTWSSKSSRKFFWSKFADKKRAAVLVVKMATHFLTDRSLPTWKKEQYVEAINWAIKI